MQRKQNSLVPIGEVVMRARGRGQQTARAVVLEGLHAIQENQDALESIRSCITKEVIPEEQESSDQDTQRDQPPTGEKLSSG